jgi:hypothetical protein
VGLNRTIAPIAVSTEDAMWVVLDFVFPTHTNHLGPTLGPLVA